MAEVWEALDESLHRPVAVKVILEAVSREPSFTERFVREARTIAGLEHPNILPVYDFGQEGESVYLVMPLVAGGSLKDRLGTNVPAAAALAWIAGVASALDFAHARGILHRDVKPANILMDTHERPLLADFGLAKSVGDASAGLTATGAVIGTPTYMSPEQAMAMTLDGRSDQYALGVIAFQLVAGVVPFSADSPLVVLQKHLQEPPPLPSSLNRSLSPAVDRAIERALRKNPADRYARCSDLAAALTLALGGPRAADLQPTTKWSTSQTSRVPAPPAPSEQETARYASGASTRPAVEQKTALISGSARRSPRKAILAGAAAIAAIAVALFVWRTRETSPRSRPGGADFATTPTASASSATAGRNVQSIPSPASADSTEATRSTPSSNAAGGSAAPAAQDRRELVPTFPPARPARTPAPVVKQKHPPSADVARQGSGSVAPPPPASGDSVWANAFEAGQSAFRSGDYRGAARHWRDAVGEAEKFGAKDPRLARSLQRLGVVLANLGQMPRAEKSLRDALAIRLERSDGSAMDLADCQVWLGFVLARQGRASGESEKLLLQALAAKEKELGSNAPAVAFVLQQLAYCYEMQTRHADAEPRLRRAMSILDNAPGDNDGLRAGVWNDLGWIYAREGEPAKAEPAFRKALDLRKRTLAPNHPLVAVSEFGLATAQIDLKKYSEAESLLKQSLAIREKSLGPEHPQVAATLRELARLLRLQNRAGEAEQFQARARAIRARRQEAE